MAKFRDANDSGTSTENSPRWETLDLSNPKTFEVDADDDKLEIEIETDSDEPVKVDATTDKVEDISTREPSRAEIRIRELSRKGKEKDQQIEQMRQALAESQKQSEINRQSDIDGRKKTNEELLKSYEKEYEAAVLNGDVKNQAALTAKMTRANVELMALDTLKPIEVKTQPVVQPSYINQRDAVLEKLPEAGKEWAKKNKWFVTNQALTQQAIGIAGEVEAEGFDPEDSDYYEQIEERLAEMYPARFKKQEAKIKVVEEVKEPVKAKQSPVAQSSRTNPTQKAGTVRLTKEDVALAKKWRIPLEQFAVEKRKLEQAEKSGSRTTTIFE